MSNGANTDPDEADHPATAVEKLINAVDEVRDAIDRLTAENRTAGRRADDDPALREPFSPKKPLQRTRRSTVSEF
jgi:hypothetical protein